MGYGYDAEVQPHYEALNASIAKDATSTEATLDEEKRFSLEWSRDQLRSTQNAVRYHAARILGGGAVFFTVYAAWWIAVLCGWLR